jgi:hypothetical protein
MINQRLQVRLNIVWLHRARVTAVPPLLQFTDQSDGEQGEHRCSRTRPWLEQLHRVRRASARREIWNKTSAHPPPAGLLAPPGQATAWPRQLFTVEQSTAWADHSKAVLPPWTGMDTAGSQQIVNLWTAHDDLKARARAIQSGQKTKNHPRRGG